MRRLLLAIIAVPLVLAGAVALAVWLTLPPSHQKLHIAGLKAPVDISLDAYGIPRIHAQSEPDAAAALGYVHARDRMFQMELMRRAASGTLSAIVGPRALPVDRMARIFGERLHAEASFSGLSPELRAILTSYAAGVNAWIGERGRMAAPEFLALGAPRPWKPSDCLLWSETVSLWLADNYRSELSHMAMAGTVAPDRIAQLWPPTADTPAPDSTTPPPLQRQGWLDWLPRFPQPFTLPSEASNAWAVSGAHTSTGAALMAGDPHLALGFPSLWYLARIETPGGVLVGATAPGVPFLVIGRNAHIGWSFTTTGIDTQDVFIETELPGGMYATPDGPKPFTTREEVIHVRGAPDEHLVVRATRHGAVISDGKPGPVLAVEMAQFELGSPAPGLYALNHAATVADAGHAAAMMTAPMQNLTVAGPDGIGLFTTGRVPVRKSEDSEVPVSGADGQHDWTGFASGDALPHFVNPASGTVENANERTDTRPAHPRAAGRQAELRRGRFPGHAGRRCERAGAGRAAGAERFAASGRCDRAGAGTVGRLAGCDGQIAPGAADIQRRRAAFRRPDARRQPCGGSGVRPLGQLPRLADHAAWCRLVRRRLPAGAVPGAA
jgi:penicillin amidase